MTYRTSFKTEVLDACEITQRGLWGELQDFAQRDPARHYFILLGLLSPEKTFQSVITLRRIDDSLLAVFLKRASGNAQLMMDSEIVSEEAHHVGLNAFASAIRNCGFNQLIAAASYCRRLEPFELFTSHSIGAEIAVMPAFTAASAALDNAVRYEIEPLMPGDLDEVIELYQKCFHAFTPRPNGGKACLGTRARRHRPG